MAEVVWQARRVSDGVLVDVTGDTAGTPVSAPTPNALEVGAGGGAGVTVDNQVDAPAEVTTIISPAASVSGATAYTRPVIVSATDPSDVSWSGDSNYDGVLWLQTGELVRYVALRVWESGDGIWLDAGIGDMLAGNSFEMTGFSASGTEGDATFTFGGNPDGAINFHLKDEDGANDRHYYLLMGDAAASLSFTDPDAISPDNSVALGPTGIAIVATGIGFYDAPPAARPVVPLTTPDVQDVIDALVTLGLVTQSD